jgi:hypothetical protein
MPTLDEVTTVDQVVEYGIAQLMRFGRRADDGD